MDSLQDAVRPERGGCGPALGKLVPVGFRAEAWRLFVLSGPLFLFQVLSFMIYVVSSVFCGHLGRVELASVTLSVAFINVCGVSVGLGFSSACDTLMSQSFGSPNKKHVGVILQRGALILLLCCFPCWALFLNTQHLLLLLRQDPAVSRLTHEYVLIFMPALPPAGKIPAKPGDRLAPSPQRPRGQPHQRLGQLRPGFGAEPGGQGLCLRQHPLPVRADGIPAALHRAEEAASGDVGRLVRAVPAGLGPLLLPGPPQHAHDMHRVVGLRDRQLPHGPAEHGGSLCPGRHLRGGYRHLHVGTSLVIGALLSLLKNNLGYIFTNDEEVIALVNKVMPIYIVFQLFEAICCVYGGVLRGTGRQAFGALVNAIAYYAIGLPLGIVLAFVVRMRTMGLWLGMLVCGVLAAAALAAYTARMDWALAAEEAEKYAGLRQQGTEYPESGAPRAGPEEGAGSAVATGTCPGVSLTMFSSPGCHADHFRTPDAALALPAPPSGLSGRQLALRRGAALGAASATLTAGLVVSLLASRH
ncbi:multidrug and toxin extrusion protein 2 isoform X3 [Myotis myotis]|uniref:multidrug and toxin extrusion protein 2 isoform X3 n=1 Tax=Myotis myotis TaxID=51298 RepID=UPI00174D911B|nr:multidrug and toxin extrusion protein 2 isoform X3 [Myotis myotis]